MTNTLIKPFQIAINDAVIEDLKQRLANTRWPEKETVTDWSQGMPLAYSQELCEYWLNDYDWRQREARLNRYPQFTTELNDLAVHFVHVRSAHADAKPLLMTHGWPGSIAEFQAVIGPLVDPEAHGGKAEDAFHVVCPSLPGFGFSAKPASTGWSVDKIAQTWDLLMLRLGYSRYVAQGGDWGSIVTTTIAEQNLGHCEAIHVNMVVVEPDPATMDELTAIEQDAIAGIQYYYDSDSGYSKQQSTRPQTLAYGLTDSPVGQMTWMLEKFYAWMDCNGHPENVLSKDQLLDNVMLYWCTASAASSARLYWESFNNLSMREITLPVGCSVYPKDIFRASRRWAERRFKNLIHWSAFDQGGHFAALERPETFVDEVRSCFRTLR